MSAAGPPSASLFPGPTALGRGVVVGEGGATPEGFEDVPRVVVDRVLLADIDRLAEAVDLLHRRWVARRPNLIELAVDESKLRMSEIERRSPWELGATFTFLRERLFFLVWANTWDARKDGPPVWWWGRKAMSLGAAPGDDTDVVLPDGTAVWIDAGPRQPLDLPVVHAESVILGRLTPSPPPTAPTDDLAPDQLDAVGHVVGPARVIAPAGSGKTRTLVARVRHLVDDRGVEPELVTALAYNNRAAAEMVERLERPDTSVRTIHSLGWQILRESRPGVRMLDEAEVRKRLEPLTPTTPRFNTDTIGPYLEALSQVRIGLEAPIAVESERDDVDDFPRVFEAYRSQLRSRNEADFDEQIYGAIEALITDHRLRRRWQDRCRHLLVDEFQDLTPGYLLLLRLVSTPELNVFGVGDDDQTIYGYAGADPRFLIDFDRWFPGAGEHALTVNYRCPAVVTEGVTTLLAHNRRRIDKEIKAGPDTVAEETALQVETVPSTAMATTAAGLVARRYEDSGADQIAVLCRVNSALLPVHVALAEIDIPFVSPINRALLDRTVMRAALAWIRLALDPKAMTRSNLHEAIRRPHRRINRLAGEIFGRRNTFSIEDLRDAGRELDGNQATNWDGFVADIQRVARIAGQNDARVLLDVLIADVGLGKAAAALDSGRTRADRAAQGDDVIALRRAADVHPELDTFESWLRQRLTAASDASGVTLTTVHRVKGMEWDHVVVFGADRGLLPHDLSNDLEEERRVMHVALTRGIRSVSVVSDANRPSRFIAEMSALPAPATADEPSVPRIPKGRAVSVAVGDTVRVGGGFVGEVDEVGTDGVVVLLRPGPGSLSVRWGETVTVGDITGALAPAAELSAVAVDQGLLEALKAWRLETARTRKVPAFVVFKDSTLEEIAATTPTTEQDLARIAGIGPSKLDDFGEDLLDLVATHLA